MSYALGTVNLGASPTGVGGDSNRAAFEKVNANAALLGVAALQEAVAGGAGFANASGAVSLDLAEGRAFLLNVTGNITSLAFTNAPSTSERATNILLAIRIDAIGSHTIGGLPTVTWLDGSTWDDLNLAADAINLVHLLTVGTVTYASFLYSGELAGDPYKVCFLENATVLIVTENEYIDVPNATKPQGNGTIAYQKNGSTITLRTLFAEGDRLGIVCTALTTTTAVRVPRVLV